MEPHERRRLLKDIELPTERVRKQVLDIFQDLAIAKNDIPYFLAAEISFVIDQLWVGDDKPTLDDIEFYLEQAVATNPTQYKKHARMGYRYLYNRDH
jgi:hypothetical protein